MRLHRLESTSFAASLGLALLTSMAACGPRDYVGRNCDSIALGARADTLTPVLSTVGKPHTLCGQCMLGVIVRATTNYDCCMLHKEGDGGTCGVDCQAYADSLSRVTLGGRYLGDGCGMPGGSTNECSVFVRDGQVEAVHTYCLD